MTTGALLNDFNTELRKDLIYLRWTKGRKKLGESDNYAGMK